jgi:hypothetical protein
MRYLVLALVATTLGCADEIIEPGPPPGPSARALHATAYFPPQQQILIFGGNAGSGPLNELWAWNGTWSRLQATPAPPARLEPLMTFDSRRNRMLLFGGTDASFNRLRDLWAWNGTAWTQLSSDAPQLQHPALGFDPERDRVVLVGGTSDANLRETWEWNGSAWSRVSTSFPSTNRQLPTRMVYNAARKTLQTVVTDMNAGSTGARPGQLWEWNGAAWVVVAAQFVSTNPPGGMFALTSGELLLHDTGGSTVTHRWNGQGWSSIPGTTRPATRFFTDAEAHTARNVAVLFGGMLSSNQQLSNETWVFNGTSWSQVPTVGS